MVSRQIRVIISALDGFVTKIIKKLVLDIVANLQAAPSQDGTPVATGWARANWIPTFGGTLSSKAAPRPALRNISVFVASVQQQGSAAVARVATSYDVSKGSVTIQNNVPYILPLDAGSSEQTPRGFVRRGIVKAISFDLTA